MIEAIIVDDEKPARETIANIIKLYCSDVSVIAEAEDISSAFKAIEQHKPQLVFLDIDMPGGSGFDLLKKFNPLPFHVVFITAYQEHAVKAFKFSAIDYILKPINPDELIEAVKKTKSLLEKNSLSVRLDAFLNYFHQPNSDNKRIVLKTSDQIYIINVKDIVRCESDGNYTYFFTIDGKKILVSTTIKEYEEMLSGFHFFRTHQSHLVNTNFIERFDKKDGGSVIMKDNSSIPVAVRKKEALLSLLSRI
jgi:two-component system, LytTR family, response regulator